MSTQSCQADNEIDVVQSHEWVERNGGLGITEGVGGEEGARMGGKKQKG